MATITIPNDYQILIIYNPIWLSDDVLLFIGYYNVIYYARRDEDDNVIAIVAHRICRETGGIVFNGIILVPLHPK